MRTKGPEPRAGARGVPVEREGERVMQGLAVSPGIAIGPVHLHGSGAIAVPSYVVAPDCVDQELARLKGAIDKSLRQLAKLRDKTAALPGGTAEEVSFLLDAHAQMLSGSRLVRGVEARIAGTLINGERAVQLEIEALAESFARMEDPYLAARVQDVREVGHRLIRNLTQTPFDAFKQVPTGAVVVAEELTPADTALLAPRAIAGLATVLGGAEGHTAILARALGLPAVLGVAGLAVAVRAGDVIIVDGYAGRVVLRPSAATLRAYAQRRVQAQRMARALARLARLPAVTRDGVEIRLEANIELPREVDAVKAVGAVGIGLLRSEFMFMNRTDLPEEDEQYEILREVVTGLGGRPATIRTLDIGGEKTAMALDGLGTAGPNPALGLRAIRLSLRHPRLLEAQFAAILRAGAHGPVRILLPMITSAAEVRQAREILARVARRLVRRGVAMADPMPPVGIMIEVPGAALSADALAQTSDFFAIGTNDLTQYTLAIDRGDEQVASLYNPLHPAVLRLIQFTTAAALRQRIPVSICGEVAGDPRFTALLLGLGMRELSMSPLNLPRVKARVRGLDLAAATTRAHAIMDQSDPGRIAALLDDFNALQ